MIHPVKKKRLVARGTRFEARGFRCEQRGMKNEKMKNEANPFFILNS